MYNSMACEGNVSPNATESLEDSEIYAFVTISSSSFTNIGEMDISISTVLRFCKKKVLLPYSRWLSILGWRPLFQESEHYDNNNTCIKFMNTVYMCIMILLVLGGYILEYAACFRRDGFAAYKETIDIKIYSEGYSFFSKVLQIFKTAQNISLSTATATTIETQLHLTCSGGVFSMYVFPSLTHFISYICMLYQMRISHHEQLETLMERVFLQSTFAQSWHFAQRQLIKKLRFLLILGFLWLFVSVASQLLLLHVRFNITQSFTWMQPNSLTGILILDILIIVTSTLNDGICIAIVTSYCFHCQLIVSYLQNLCQAVMLKSIVIEQLYKEVQEARKCIKYLNDHKAIGVSLLSISFGCKITTCLYGIISGESDSSKDWFIFSSTCISLVFWILLLLLPILQAVRLTEACSGIVKLGHEIRARPYGYQSVSQTDLDSLVLFTGSLSMHARIFRIPVRSSCVLLAFVAIIFAVIILGQIGLTHFGSF